jgi:hypothetical protein
MASVVLAPLDSRRIEKDFWNAICSETIPEIFHATCVRCFDRKSGWVFH